MGVSIQQWRNAIGCHSCNYNGISSKSLKTSTTTLPVSKLRILIYISTLIVLLTTLICVVYSSHIIQTILPPLPSQSTSPTVCPAWTSPCSQSTWLQLSSTVLMSAVPWHPPWPPDIYPSLSPCSQVWPSAPSKSIQTACLSTSSPSCSPPWPSVQFASWQTPWLGTRSTFYSSPGLSASWLTPSPAPWLPSCPAAWTSAIPAVWQHHYLLPRSLPCSSAWPRPHSSNKLRNRMARSINGNRDSKGIRLAHWNAGSAHLKNKIHEIEQVVSDHHPHLLGFSEANHRRVHDIEDVQLQAE